MFRGGTGLPRDYYNTQSTGPINKLYFVVVVKSRANAHGSEDAVAARIGRARIGTAERVRSLLTR